MIQLWGDKNEELLLTTQEDTKIDYTEEYDGLLRNRAPDYLLHCRRWKKMYEVKSYWSKRREKIRLKKIKSNFFYQNCYFLFTMEVEE